jgi:hypothetical protein
MAKLTHIKNRNTIKRAESTTKEQPKPVKKGVTKIKTFRKELVVDIKEPLIGPYPTIDIKIALVCIAKNEDHYIKEWVDYHKIIGFDHIFIYQNNWRCAVNDQDVTKIDFDGQTKQVEAYNDFIQNRSADYDWVAFLDIDEFLVLNQHRDVKHFINDYSEFEAVGINWKLFGDNGLTNVVDGNYNVLSRFKMAQNGLNPHIKTIVKLGNPDLYMYVHGPSCNIKVVGTDKEVITDEHNQLNENGLYDIAQINHYFVKTKPEFIKKIARGRAGDFGFKELSNFETHNTNDIKDLSIFLYLLKKLTRENL